jgi:uncharacterized protein YndB with AHSA1/START domain
MTRRRRSATTLEERELVITRIFDAPRERLWKAWTNPALVSQWWGPAGFTTTVREMDVRPGGVWRFVERSPDGQDYWSTGAYREIVEPERIVLSFEFDGMPGHVSVVTVTFEQHEGRTKLTLRHVGLPAGVDQDMASQGWNESFDKLAEVLAEA